MSFTNNFLLLLFFFGRGEKGGGGIISQNGYCTISVNVRHSLTSRKENHFTSTNLLFFLGYFAKKECLLI